MGYKSKSRRRNFFCFWKVSSSCRKAPNANIYCQRTKLWERNVFRSICLSTGGLCKDRGLFPGVSLSRGVSVQREGSLSRGSLVGGGSLPPRALLIALEGRAVRILQECILVQIAFCVREKV